MRGLRSADSTLYWVCKAARFILNAHHVANKILHEDHSREGQSSCSAAARDTNQDAPVELRFRAQGCDDEVPLMGSVGADSDSGVVVRFGDLCIAGNARVAACRAATLQVLAHRILLAWRAKLLSRRRLPLGQLTENELLP